MTATGGGLRDGNVVGLDGGTQDRDSTERLLGSIVDRVRGSGLTVTLACTHFVTRPERHWAASLLVRRRAPDVGVLPDGVSMVAVDDRGGARGGGGSPQWAAGAASAAEQLLASSARVVVFDGQDLLPPALPVEDVLALTAIEEVRGVGGTSTAGQLLHTRGYVRPNLIQGRLVLHVRPYGEDGHVAPFEVPHPTPCCAAHG